MSTLTIRAEQALIGAMLAGQRLPPETEHHLAETFGHQSLRHLYTTILDLREHHHGDDLLQHVANRVNEPGVDAGWLRQLRDTCPTAAHIASYARMVQVAGFRRATIEHSQRITSSTGHPAGQAPAATTRMALALQRQTGAYQAFTSIDEQQALTLWQPPAHEYQKAKTDGDRDDKEDEILASLLAQPGQATSVAQFVQADTFTSDQRREIFTTLVSLATAGESIDELILAWETEQLRATAALYSPNRTDSEPDNGRYSAEARAAYLHRLATMTVAAGAAIAVGHELVVADVKAQLAQSAAEAAQRQAGVSGPVQGQPQPDIALDPTLITPAATEPGQQPAIEM